LREASMGETYMPPTDEEIESRYLKEPLFHLMVDAGVNAILSHPLIGVLAEEQPDVGFIGYNISTELLRHKRWRKLAEGE